MSGNAGNEKLRTIDTEERSAMGVAVGIDIAKEFHWATATDRTSGDVLFSRRVENEPVSIAELIDELDRLRVEHGPAIVGIDVIGGIANLLVAMLAEAGTAIVHVPGLAVNRARQGTVGGEHKSDPRDAAVIADQVRVRRDLRPVEIDEEIDVEIRLLVSRRRDLVGDQTRRIARLRDLLASIHPGLERVVDPTQKTSLWLLSRYVTPAEIRRAGRKRMIDYLNRAGGLPRRHIEQLVDAALAAAKTQRLTVPGERVAAELVRELALELRQLRDRLTLLDREIETALQRHPDAALIRSLPGMGATLTAEFIAEAGNLTRFPTPDNLASAAGLAPILKQSGKVRYLQRARRANKTLKRVFYQSAFCSLGHPTSRAFYERKRAEGKRHHQAVLALARRRVNVLHAILRDRRPFEIKLAKTA
jgi:transposase